MIYLQRCLLMIVVLSCLATKSCFGQSSLVDGISVAGSHSVEKPASWMCMKMKIEAKGENFQRAMESLAKKKKKAQVKLEKLGAVEGSIKFEPGAAGASGGTSDMLTQMKRVYGNDPRVAKMMKVKPPVTVSVQLTAKWEISGDGDELLLQCDQQKNKITKDDIGGTVDPDELSAEQEELAEELAEMASEYGGYGGREEAPAGQPSFYYLARFDKTEIDQAMKTAFDKARISAEKLANASGASLGQLKSLSSGAANGYDRYYDAYGNRSSVPSPTELEDGGVEIASQNPLTVTYNARIAVAFKIE